MGVKGVMSLGNGGTGTAWIYVGSDLVETAAHQAHQLRQQYQQQQQSWIQWSGSNESEGKPNKMSNPIGKHTPRSRTTRMSLRTMARTLDVDVDVDVALQRSS